MPFVEKESKNIEGMTVDAYLRLHNQMHSDELGVTKKEIIVPSFGTTAKIFTQHFAILRDLKHKIELLKQSYEYQRSEDRSWENVNQILGVIEQAMYYLDFVPDEEI